MKPPTDKEMLDFLATNEVSFRCYHDSEDCKIFEVHLDLTSAAFVRERAEAKTRPAALRAALRKLMMRCK